MPDFRGFLLYLFASPFPSNLDLEIEEAPSISF
jgi:hypothetical protein